MYITTRGCKPCSSSMSGVAELYACLRLLRQAYQCLQLSIETLTYLDAIAIAQQHMAAADAVVERDLVSTCAAVAGAWLKLCRC